jgi:hypothetical protein
VVILEDGALFQEQGKLLGRSQTLLEPIQQSWDAQLLGVSTFLALGGGGGDSNRVPAGGGELVTSEDMTLLTCFATMGSTAGLACSSVAAGAGGAGCGPCSDGPLVSRISPLCFPSELFSRAAAAPVSSCAGLTSSVKLVGRSCWCCWESGRASSSLELGNSAMATQDGWMVVR